MKKLFSIKYIALMAFVIGLGLFIVIVGRPEGVSEIALLIYMASVVFKDLQNSISWDRLGELVLKKSSPEINFLYTFGIILLLIRAFVLKDYSPQIILLLIFGLVTLREIRD